MEIVAKNPGIGGDLLRCVGCASSKRLKQAEVNGVQQNDLLLSRALDHGHLAMAHPLEDLAGSILQVHLGDHCSRHG